LGPSRSSIRDRRDIKKAKFLTAKEDDVAPPRAEGAAFRRRNFEISPGIDVSGGAASESEDGEVEIEIFSLFWVRKRGAPSENSASRFQ